MIDPPPKHNMK